MARREGGRLRAGLEGIHPNDTFKMLDEIIFQYLYLPVGM